VHANQSGSTKSGKPDRAALVEAWTETYGSPPPKGISTRLLGLAIAYEQQVKTHGGLSKAAKRKLAAIASEACSSPTCEDAIEVDAMVADCTKSRHSIRPQAGTRLMREWNGKTHVVDVLDKGVLYNGRTYRSLSSVARAITGARWSGPRFFGLDEGAP